MSPWYYTTGLVIYKKELPIDFERGSQLKLKKLQQRLESNLNYAFHHKLELSRLNAKEIIFREEWHRILAAGKTQIMRGHLRLIPNQKKAVIIGRLNKSIILADMLLLLLPLKFIENNYIAITTCLALGIALYFITKNGVYKAHAERFNELGAAVIDVLNEPNKTFKYTPYRSQDAHNARAS